MDQINRFNLSYGLPALTIDPMYQNLEFGKL